MALPPCGQCSPAGALRTGPASGEASIGNPWDGVTLPGGSALEIEQDAQAVLDLVHGTCRDRAPALR